MTCTRSSAAKRCAIAAVVGLAAAAHGQSYSIVDLGTLSGGFSSSAAAINNRGQIVGQSDLSTPEASGRHAFVRARGVMTDLGLAERAFALSSEATAINAMGAVVFNVSDGLPHAYLASGGSIVDLTTMPDAVYSEGFAINGRGQVVGTVVPEAGGAFPHHAFIYSRGVMQDLNPMLFGGPYSEGKGINDAGQIVGDASYPSGMIHAYVLTQEDSVKDLGTLGGNSSSAEAINNAGQIVGYSYVTPDQSGAHAFLYQAGHMIDLGILPGAVSSSAAAINGSGQIVGTSVMPGHHITRAFIYTGGAMRDLNSLIRSGTGWTLESANGINDLGQVVGQGRIGSARHAFLLMPLAVSANGERAVP